MSDTEKTGRPQYTNALIHEKSPYLLQHAHNPVDWHAWGPEALEKARAEDKMLLISIGYATCHWCHVMERESFEDPELAEYLNAHFIPIKVDREERPDVDKIYMDALQAMGVQGGWPLNMFAMPNGAPVTGGTYFPPSDAHGRKSFRNVLQIIAEAWQKDRASIEENAKSLTEHLQRPLPGQGTPSQPWDAAPLEAAVALYRRTYDAPRGGFALQQQNKFPPSMGLMLLMRHWRRTGDGEALNMVETTLKKMLSGGIYDQLGGGLSRYSTDYDWLVPHFEKMLYDNALFLQALVECYQVTGNPLYGVFADDVLTYVERDMRHPDGPFYSAEDADSEGEEGLFYVWTPEEIAALLPADQATAATAYWQVRAGGNFEGRSILHAPQPLAEVAAALSMDEDALATHLLAAREVLLAARSKRERPLRDEKVLTSWNALMVSAMCRAGMAMGDPSRIDGAVKPAEFLFAHCMDGEGRLLRRWADGEGRYRAYLVDHGALAVACLDLYQATFAPIWFTRALELSKDIQRLFFNPDGPYFETAADAEELITRPIDGYDGVEPSGNSQAALAFLRLHAYGVENGLEAGALRILHGFRPHLEQAGVSFAAMLSALELHVEPPLEIAVVGEPDDPETKAMLQALREMYLPHAVIAHAAPADVAGLGDLIPLLQGREAIGGKPTAYVCRNRVCQLPVHTTAALIEQIGALG